MRRFMLFVLRLRLRLLYPAVNSPRLVWTVAQRDILNMHVNEDDAVHGVLHSGVNSGPRPRPPPLQTTFETSKGLPPRAAGPSPHDGSSSARARRFHANMHAASDTNPALHGFAVRPRYIKTPVPDQLAGVCVDSLSNLCC